VTFLKNYVENIAENVEHINWHRQLNG